ncbi:MAG: protein YebE [Deltaproteobacteria bacterium]|nr:MAG: protein YebE [Deltaproteobacteria bacterium]
MIRPELLAKILSGVMDGMGKNKGKKSGFMDSILGSLGSGKGLMTAIGLGVGAYEILQGKRTSSSGSNAFMPEMPPMPPAGSTAPPPLSQNSEEMQTDEDELALRFIRVMVAAAYADGKLDQEEKSRIISAIEKQELTEEEKHFIADEFHQPRPISELTAGINEPAIAQALYQTALSAIDVDTPEERKWLNELAASLAIPEQERVAR